MKQKVERQEPPIHRRIIKRVEAANRAAWFRLFRRSWNNRPLEGRLDPRKVNRVLMLRYDAIGDMITTLPAIRLMKRLNPDMKIDVLASERNRRIIEHDPNVNEILLLHNSPGRFIRDIRHAARNHYDVIFCCVFGKASKVGIIANLIGRPDTVKATTWRDYRYTTLFNLQSREAAGQASMWDKMLHLVPATFDYQLQPGDEQPYLAIDDGSRSDARQALEAGGIGAETPYVAINLTSLQQRNRWTADGYAELVRAVLAHDPALHIALLWMGPDLPMARAVRQAMPDDQRHRVMIYPATGNVLEIAAVVEQSRAVFSPDTGVVHMASATGRPVMGLYVKGTRAITEWRPYGVPHRMLESSERNEHVAHIPADAAVEMFLDLLADVGRPGGWEDGRMGRREDGKTGGWEAGRMGSREDGKPG